MYTIVVADDEEELRRAIIRKIDWESIGFQVVGEAENGIEALELVERMEPDLLLTDAFCLRNRAGKTGQRGTSYHTDRLLKRLR